jgi:hypothetical protein
MTPTPVGDHEWLYRAIPSNGTGYRMTEEGLRISASAFADRQRRPSVDRSALRADPADARLGANDGVTRLLTHDVRRIGHIRVAPNDPASARVYTVDVVHRPTSIANGDPRDNPAHCQIECRPPFANDTHYRKLIEALAKLATHQGWVIPPRE